MWLNMDNCLVAGSLFVNTFSALMFAYEPKICHKVFINMTNKLPEGQQIYTVNHSDVLPILNVYFNEK